MLCEALLAELSAHCTNQYPVDTTLLLSSLKALKFISHSSVYAYILCSLNANKNSLYFPSEFEQKRIEILQLKRYPIRLLDL